MIPPEQLRIGNIACLDPDDQENTMCVMLEIANTNLKAKQGHGTFWVQPDDLYPVDLTDSIISTLFKGNTDWIPDFLQPVELNLMQEAKTFCFDSKGQQLRHAHSLQNLYFAHSGKELSWK